MNFNQYTNPDLIKFIGNLMPNFHKIAYIGLCKMKSNTSEMLGHLCVKTDLRQHDVFDILEVLSKDYSDKRIIKREMDYYITIALRDLTEGFKEELEKCFLISAKIDTELRETKANKLNKSVFQKPILNGGSFS